MATKYTRFRLKGTTAADGTANVTSNSVIRGRIHSILCNVSALDNTADMTLITDDETPSQKILDLTDMTANVLVRPKVLATLNTGGALTATGNIYTEYMIFSRISATIVQGGDKKEFTVDLYVEEY